MIGATGYSGRKLVRILSAHPNVQLSFVTSARESGRRYSDLFPEFAGICDLGLISPEEARKRKVSALFLALGHGEAIAFLKSYPRLGDTRVIDLSADFRFKNPATFKAAYGIPVPADLNRKFVYGLTEVFRKNIQTARRVANPGCYVTSVLLPLYPLLARKVLRPSGPIVVSSASGVSGAGATPKTETHFCEVGDDFTAYKPLRSHRHLPEMEEVLSAYGARILFTPHLLPVQDGILSDIYIRVPKAGPALEKKIFDTWRDFYRDSAFVRSVRHLPHVSEVVGTNQARFTARVDAKTGSVLILSALDNLIKGAAGQAVQNLNVMCGWPEETGLTGRF